MASLRNPQTGCSWDLEQNFKTIASFTLEEACEVVDAIEREDYENLCEELGDLLFQIIFHARMAEEAGHFDFSCIVNAIIAKLIRRHPHIFPNGTVDSENRSENRLNSDQVKERWEEIKLEEKRARSIQKTISALPNDLPAALPALKKADKIQQAAARAGFDWDKPDQVEMKIQEELQEIKEAIALKQSANRIEEEVGDLFFSCVNYARHLKVDPEMALRSATRKFENRFRKMENSVTADNKDFSVFSLAEMERYWQQAKS